MSIDQKNSRTSNEKKKEPLDNIQHHFMLKVLKNHRLKGTHLNIINTECDKHTDTQLA